MLFSTRYFFALLLSALPLTQAATLNNNAITAPIAGDVITAGETYAIKWTNIKGNSVTITLIDGPANQIKSVKEVITNAPNTGVYTWSVPDDLPASQTYALRITYNNNPADFNYSDRFTFENESVVSSAAVSSKAESTTAAATTETATASSVASSETESAASETTASTTESEAASTTVASTESELTTSAASSESETETATSRATETTLNTRASSTTTSRATRSTGAIQTDMAPVDHQSSASRSISDRSLSGLIVAIAGMTIGGAFVMF